MFRIFARLGVVTLAVVTVLFGAGSVALAHVTVHSDDAVQGGSAEVVFRVPTESETARTVKVEVALPTDTPIANVAVRPLSGWTYEVKKTRLSNPVADAHGKEVSEVVSQVSWSATDTKLAPGPGEYQDFQLVAKPLPETNQLVFKVVQRYDDGTVARWIDLPVDGGPEPEHPAPVLALAAAPAGHSGHGDVAAAPAGSSRVATTSTTPPTWWAGVGIALAALIAALAAGYLAIRTASRRGGGSPG